MERHWDTASKHEHSAPADEAVLALRQSFCDHLVSARKQRNLSIHEIAGVTRIPVRSLERLECGLFEELPADVFVRGFLRSYARCVGLDVEETIRRYTACGMPPAPVASPMADKLAGSMATLHEGGQPSVRQVTAPLPVQAPSEDGIGTSPGWQTQPAPHATARMSRAATSAGTGIDSDSALATTGQVSAHRSATIEPATQPHQAHDASASAPVRAQVAAPAMSASAAGTTAWPDEQLAEERPARRKRRRRRRQRRDVGDVTVDAATEVTVDVTAGTPGVQQDAEVPSVSAQAPANSAPRASAGETITESVTDAPAGISAPVVEIVASEASRPHGESTSDTAMRVVRAATAAEHAAVRPITAHPRASTQSARTQPARRGRAATVSARPVLIIDDAHPEEAERAQEERVERSDSAWRSLLPPSLLDSDDGSHRGTLTLAVIILVIVATLTMSYLLRRPNVSGDGVTWHAAPALDEHRLG